MIVDEGDLLVKESSLVAIEFHAGRIHFLEVRESRQVNGPMVRLSREHDADVHTAKRCQLQGVRELAAEILQKQVRIGRPLRLRGLAEAVSGPAFAACAGMISFSIENPAALPAITQPFWREEPGRITGRLGQWLRAHL